MGWAHATGFALAALILSIVLLLVARPASLLTARVLRTPTDAVDWSAVQRGVIERLRTAGPGAFWFWGQRPLDDSENGFRAFHEAASILSAPNRVADPLGSFRSIELQLQRALAAPRCTLYDAEELAAWRAALERATPRPGSVAAAVLTQVEMRRSGMPDRTAAPLLALGHELAAAGHLDAARECFATADAVARRIMASSRCSSVAMSCARLRATSGDSLSRLAAAAGRLSDAERYADQADLARRFISVYRERLVGRPIDVLSGGQTTVVRLQPFRAASSALMAAGALGVGAASSAVVLAFAMVAYFVMRLMGRPNAIPLIALLNGRSSWLGLCFRVLIVPGIGAGIFLMVPIDARQLWATGWIIPLFSLIGLFTVAAIAWAARGLVSSQSPSITERLVPFVLLVVVLATALPLWQFFGDDPNAFDASAQLDRRIAATKAVLISVLVVSGMIGVLAVGVMVWNRKRRLGEDSAKTASAWGRRCATCRAVAVVAALGWLTCGVATMLATRTFHQLEHRHHERMFQDIGDEVTARLGPRWRETFFPDSSSR